MTTKQPRSGLDELLSFHTFATFLLPKSSGTRTPQKRIPPDVSEVLHGGENATHPYVLVVEYCHKWNT